MIQIYTGKGKGKTTAGLGLAIRAFGQDLKVAIVYFDKGGQDYGERKVLQKLGIPFFVTGLNRRNEDGTFRFTITDEDRTEAKRGLNVVNDLFHQDYDVIILDEINSTVALDMLDEAEVCAMMRSKPEALELVMTGRNVPLSMLELADLVTEMTPIKHYFNKGVPARRGIEF